MASRLPLLTHPDTLSIVAWRAGVAVTRQQFLADVRALASSLPPERHFINACEDRYRFAVGLCAGLISDRISLLPSTLTAEVIDRLREFAADAFMLVDRDETRFKLPVVRYPDTPATPSAADHDVPQVAADATAAWVFTSGSTGRPEAHRKTWGSLVRDTQTEARELGLRGAFHLVGTVPAQHMYGLESTVLIALQNDGSFAAERPFFPAEVYAALAALPRPRMLVTTPYHLRNLLAADDPVPPADLLLSATAPLSTELAAQAEAAFDAPLMEIYGCTETGQIATRRRTQSEEWKLFDGVVLDEREGRHWASGGHVEQANPLADEIRPVSPERFLLGGRSADMVNIAGKRTSLGFLNHQLLAIEGVVDGSFLMPDDEDADAVRRLAALVVAPTLDTAALLTALRQRIEPAFLPRPLVKVAALPRNATGKLPREACRALLDGAPLRVALDIPADHPAFAGHFPARPIVPGALLLAHVLLAAQGQHAAPTGGWNIPSAKFLSPASPGEALSVEFGPPSSSATIAFSIHTADRLIARGTLQPADTAT